MIIFLYGEDEFRSREKLREIKDKFLEKSSSSGVSSAFDFEEEKNIAFGEIKKAVGTRGLFFDKQLVIIKNTISQAPKELVKQVVDFLKSMKDISEDKELVIVFWEKGKVNEKSELFNFLAKNSKGQKFDLLAGTKLNNWINSEFLKENNKVKISSQAVEKLVVYTGGDLQLLSGEIKKIASYKETGIIEEKDIETLVKEKVSSNIFETIEALSSKNKKLALKLLHNQIQNGDDPFYIFSMYVYQFRNFLKVSEYHERGERNNYDIAKKAGLHPLVVKKILEQIPRFSQEKLKEIYKKLQIIDEKTKTGKSDIKLELDRFIVEI